MTKHRRSVAEERRVRAGGRPRVFEGFGRFGRNARAAFLAGAALLVGTSPGAAETLYISDEYRVPLRSGPSGEHRILHYGLPTGTVLEALGADEDAGFTHVRLGNGTEGWLPNQYLVAEPIARMRLAEAEERIAALEGLLQGDDAAAALLNAREVERTNVELERRNEALANELARVRRAAEEGLALYDANQDLAQLNTNLRAEVDDLLAQRDGLEQNVERQWMLIGAGLVLVGLMLGAAIKSRPRRSRGGSWS